MALNWQGMVVIQQYPGSPETALEALATNGLDEKTAAGLLGATEDQFRQEMKHQPAWQAAWDHGRAVANAMILQGLWRNARTGDAEAARIWLHILNGPRVGLLV